MQRKKVAVVLQAIAELEGWDDVHPSVRTERDGSWKLLNAGRANLPVPSKELMARIKELEAATRLC